MRPLPLLVALVGCASDPAKQECSGLPYTPYVHELALTDFPTLVPSVAVSMGSTASGLVDRRRTVNVTLAWGSPVFHNGRLPLRDGDGHGYCPQLSSSFSATIAGIEPTQVYEGGWQCIVISGAFCIVPTLQFELPMDLHDTPVDLVFGDSSMSQTISLGDALAERTVTPIGGTWTWTRGQTVGVGWSPTTDLARLPDALADFIDAAGNRFVIDSGFTRDASSLTFTLPDQTFSGTMALELAGTVDGVAVSEVVFQDVVVN